MTDAWLWTRVALDLSLVLGMWNLLLRVRRLERR